MPAGASISIQLTDPMSPSAISMGEQHPEEPASEDVVEDAAKGIGLLAV